MKSIASSLNESSFRSNVSIVSLSAVSANRSKMSRSESRLLVVFYELLLGNFKIKSISMQICGPIYMACDIQPFFVPSFACRLCIDASIAPSSKVNRKKPYHFGNCTVSRRLHLRRVWISVKRKRPSSAYYRSANNYYFSWTVTMRCWNFYSRMHHRSEFFEIMCAECRFTTTTPGYGRDHRSKINYEWRQSP